MAIAVPAYVLYFTEYSKHSYILDRLRQMAAHKGITLAQPVLRWTVDQASITVAMAGARNAA